MEPEKSHIGDVMRERVLTSGVVVGRGGHNSAGFWAKNDSIPPDLKCGFTLIFEVEVQKPGGIAPPSLIFPLKVLTLRINNTIHNEYHQLFVICQICSMTRAVGCTFPCQFILLVAKMTHTAKTGGIAPPLFLI
jgi:hypothetical protein